MKGIISLVQNNSTQCEQTTNNCVCVACDCDCDAGSTCDAGQCQAEGIRD